MHSTCFLVLLMLPWSTSRTWAVNCPQQVQDFCNDFGSPPMVGLVPLAHNSTDHRCCSSYEGFGSLVVYHFCNQYIHFKRSLAQGHGSTETNPHSAIRNAPEGSVHTSLRSLSSLLWMRSCQCGRECAEIIHITLASGCWDQQHTPCPGSYLCIPGWPFKR